MPLRKHIRSLEALYGRYNRRQFVHPDPLEFLYHYDDPADREVVGLIAACLAYGRVAQILRSVSGVLDKLGARPARALRDSRPARMAASFSGFKHRFQTETELLALLGGMRESLRKYGSLEACFAQGLQADHENVVPALGRFVHELDPGGVCGHLLSDPARGSACKRLHLYLRWMARSDDVDPGGWDSVSPEMLLVPLDTHMHRIATALGAVSSGRKSADGKAAIEITEAFKRISPDDPVRYDFALTRLGIRDDTDMGAFFAECGVQERANA